MRNGATREVNVLEMLEQIRSALKGELIGLCSDLGIPSLSSMRYDTIAVSTTESRKEANGKVYRYPRIQLKGELKAGGKPKTRTIISWKQEKAPPYPALYRLVYLYRSIKHITKAIDNLRRGNMGTMGLW